MKPKTLSKIKEINKKFNVEDTVNKIECLIGYLEYFTNKRTRLQNEADEIVKVVDEAKEWVKTYPQQILSLIEELDKLNNSWDGDFFSMETKDWVKFKKSLTK